jgi:TRAP-type C4-dicarboxylate transport system substrate-binding protein
MRKTIGYSTLVLFVFSICVALVFSTAAFAYDENSPMVLKAGISSPPTEDEARAVTLFGNEVQKRTKGRVQFKFFTVPPSLKNPSL